MEGARAAAADIGYPVLLKAASGGGGKGMRLVESPDDLEDAFGEAASEAGAAFGDATLYVEKVLAPARHVEIQVLCDTAGGVLTLGERECSIQRRHQKLIEESPSPALTPELREEMEAAAERACRAVGYVNAGTFEFLIGPDGSFSFIELNARLQVEHPVTELCTGIDLVREQLRVAAGEPLALTGSAPRRGHAIEVRLNAEDPERLPAGRRHGVALPPGARARRALRHVPRGRRRRAALLRLAARQARRLGHRPRRGARTYGARARGDRDRGRADDARVRPRRDPQRRVRERRVLDLDSGRAGSASRRFSVMTLLLNGPHGTITVPDSVLVHIASRAARVVDGLHVRRKRSSTSRRASCGSSWPPSAASRSSRRATRARRRSPRR